MKKVLVFGLLLMTLGIKAQSLKTDEIVLTPSWQAQAEYAGIYVADVKGFYKDVGLNIRIQHPALSTSPIKYLKDGTAQVIVNHLLGALRETGNGFRMINVLQMSQNSTQVIVAHTPISQPKDLKGKRIGVWKSGFVELVYLMNEEHHLGMEFIPMVNNINLFISGAIDATIAMSYNEYYQLLMAGLRLGEDQVISLANVGYNVPEDGLYVTADYFRTHRDEVERIANATRKGWEWAAEHPEETLDIVMEATKKYGVKTNRPAQKWMLEKFLASMIENQEGKRTYVLDPSALDEANQMLLTMKAIQKRITYKQITEP
ncbi:MAG: ABC transporter substrate-binding protein [Phocaeicola sp.]|nr:ABC transporter substrate-binding protein [Phocaeicola sp.]